MKTKKGVTPKKVRDWSEALLSAGSVIVKVVRVLEGWFS